MPKKQPTRRYGQYPINHFFATDGVEKIKNRRFKVGVYRTAFTVKNLKDAPKGTDLLLEELIDHFIAEADRNAGIRAEKCSIIIRSAILEKPIQIPYRAIIQNSAQVVMQQFDDVEQSGKRLGRPSLYSQPLHIEIVMGPSDEEADELVRGLRGGSGRNRRNFEKCVDMENLIPTNNENLDPLINNHCLILAIQLGILHKKMSGNNLDIKRFQRLAKGQGNRAKQRRTQLVLSMLKQMKRRGIHYPLFEPTYTIDAHLPLVQQFLDRQYPRKYRLSVFGQNGRMRPLWKGPKRARQELCLFLKDGHYNAIRKMDAFFGKPYCIDCESTYNMKRDHRATCSAKCARCCGMGYGFPCKPKDNYIRECTDCNNIFRNRRCYDRHLADGICIVFKRCLNCGQIYRVVQEQQGRQARRQRADTIDSADDDIFSDEDDEQRDEEDMEGNRDGHVCYMRFCRLCKSIHHREEACFVQPIVPKRDKRGYLLIIYDFESTQLSPVEDAEELAEQNLVVKHLPEDDKFRVHVVNCVSAYLLCSFCMDNDAWKEERTGDCEHCGPNKARMHTWTAAEDPNPLNSFLEWLMGGLPGGRSRAIKTYALAHFGGRYDMHLLLGDLIKSFDVDPQITRAGNKLFEVRVKRMRGACPYISFRDSFNWMSLKLEQLPKALGLQIDEGGKEFFPHGWNRNANMQIQLSHLPPRDHYYPDSMAKKRLEQFNAWYAANRNTPFCLSQQIGPYCEQDCRILAHAVVKFRQLFLEIATDVKKRDDVIVNSLTLASACIRHFCINYLKPREIAIIPDNGYHHDSNQSAIALKFMRWLEHRNGWLIKTKDSAEGEHKVRLPNGQQLKLDGYVQTQRGSRDIAIEFLGCAWHGHDCLYKEHDICLNGKTALYNRDKNEERKRLLVEAGYRVFFIWECSVLAQLATDQEMAEFFEEQTEGGGPLFPRDAFQGGRTGPLALKADIEEAGAEQEYEISAYDVVSLYPSVNFNAWYPIGHPQLVDMNMAVEWSRPEDLNPYRGIFKVFLLPPDDLFLPVIAEKIHGKLVFHLCHRCARDAPYGEPLKLNQAYTQELGATMCTHTDKERGFLCTVASVELELALAHGYRVTWVYSIYHWSEWSDRLLRPYVQDMMTMKIQAKGWPNYILTADEGLRDQLKGEYLQQNQEVYGITLDESKIEKNDGLYYMSKIRLNSMWGRWGLRCNLTKDLITKCPVELHTTLNDPKLEVGAVEMLGPDLFAVPYQHRREFVRPHDKYNIVIALMTTANARCRLYHYMKCIHMTPGCILLYTDTDSCIMLHLKGQAPPFEVGDMLGQMSHEYAEWEILAFYCGGCKQYAMKLRHRQTGEIRYVVKCRGCWERVDSPLDFNQFKIMVNAYGSSEERQSVLLERTHLQPDWKQGQVTTRSQKRRYAPIYDKGFVDANLHCYPYGYRGLPLMNPLNNLP